ncbi:glycoside hydrolase family 39 [Fusarium pseudocircinatum]|uniref:Glycoside hydrolase family 39 n=1 Tax=Fusarium pseudocircinatum TaxID=56676 RepID=A0A8H5L2P6_9HYPO|nr:glycoside hydrolase family 39 [Fusarium pseudocircinatum]
MLLKRFTLATALTVCAFASTVPNDKRDALTATVTLSQDKGEPKQLVCGMLYGVPVKPNQIPDKFYTGIKFNYLRAGGAQNSAPGWLGGGEDKYRPRFNSALSNYKTARKYGARFVLLIHDLWGADSLQASDAAFPGDGGDWSNYEEFLDTVVTDIKKAGMTTGLDIDIWNEPDNGPFWGRSQDQFLELWGRTYARLRGAFGTNVSLVGPSTVSFPTTDNDWWTRYLSFISTNSSVPDIYSWHLLLDPAVDPQSSSETFNNVLRPQHNLPARPIQINEFALREEQQPAGSVWYISRFERNNIQGLRANYGFYGQLYDFQAGLLGKPHADDDQYNAEGGGYYANGEWQLLAYYANMQGRRVGTTGTSDGKFEVFATKDGSNKFKIIAGARRTMGTWKIQVKGLSSLKLSKSGSIRVQQLRFDFDGYYGKVGTPVDLGTKTYKYSNDVVTFQVTPSTINTAYAFELVA